MRFAITLTKTIVVHVDAADEPAARYQALSGETADAAYADGDWQRAEAEIKEIQPA